jgi:hypothetical protein
MPLAKQKTPKYLYLPSPSTGKPMKLDRFLDVWMVATGGNDVGDETEPGVPSEGVVIEQCRINMRTGKIAFLTYTGQYIIDDIEFP